MFRTSRTWANRARMLVVAVCLTLAAGWGTYAAPPSGKGGGGSPPPPPPPAPSTIFYNYGGSMWGMNPDGSGKRVAFASGIAPELLAMAPSSLVYGDDPILHRWWLAAEITDYYDYLYNEVGDLLPDPYPHYEIFATMPDPNEPDGYYQVQLTDFSGTMLMLSVPSWSNDGADSFVSFFGFAIPPGRIGVDENGKTYVDFTGLEREVFVVDIAGTDIDAIDQNPGLRATIDDTESVAPSVPVARFSAPDGEWSPDGDEIAFLQDGGDVWVWDVPTQSSRPAFQASVSLGRDFWWCPVSGSRELLYHRITLSSSGIYIGDADGGTPQLHVEGTSAQTVRDPRWSPLGTHLIYKREVIRAKNKWDTNPAREYSIEHISRSGGSALVLTSDLDLLTNKTIRAWVSNTPAQ